MIKSDPRQYVTDTMAIVSYLSKRKMSVAVKQFFQATDLGSHIFLYLLSFWSKSVISQKKAE